MDKRYLKIKYIGQYDFVINFLRSKEWKFDSKNIGNNTIFMKCQDESYEEICFFVNLPLEENEDNKLISIEESSLSEYEAAQEISNKPSSPVEKTLQAVHNIITGEDRVPELKDLIETTPRECSDNIQEIWDSAILPSKCVMQNNDPFRYLMSREYFLNFFVCASAVLLMLSVVS